MGEDGLERRIFKETEFEKRKDEIRHRRMWIEYFRIVADERGIKWRVVRLLSVDKTKRKYCSSVKGRLYRIRVISFLRYT